MAGNESVYIFPMKKSNARFEKWWLKKSILDKEKMVHVRFHAIEFWETAAAEKKVEGRSSIIGTRLWTCHINLLFYLVSHEKNRIDKK